MSEHSHTKKARGLLSRSGYKAGGHLGGERTIAEHVAEHVAEKAIHEHEAHDHKGEKKTRLHLKTGGSCEGFAAGGRPDRAPRAHGGKSKGKGGKTEININMGAPEKQPVPIPIPPHPPMGGPPPGAMPPHPPMPPGGAPPGGAGLGGPPGMPPGGMPPRPPGLKTGGRAKFTAGAGSGEGRLEKAEHEERRRGGKR